MAKSQDKSYYKSRQLTFTCTKRLISMAVKQKLALVVLALCIVTLYSLANKLSSISSNQNEHQRQHHMNKMNKTTVPKINKEEEDVSKNPKAMLDPDCHCKYISAQKEQLSKVSTCSQHATDRGGGQRVISYSFYGPLQSAYFNGIFENLDGVKKFYGDQNFVMRLYYDRSKASQSDSHKENYAKLCQLFCQESNFDLCDVNEIGTLHSLLQ